MFAVVIIIEADTVYSPTLRWVSGTAQEYKFSFGYDNNGVVSMKLNTETVAKVNLVRPARKNAERAIDVT